MSQALDVMSLDSRLEDMRKAAENEMNIDEYQVQPAQNQCMTDFMLFERQGPKEIDARTGGDRIFGVEAKQLPLMYYDNEDGFWDDYIAEKRQNWGEQDMITRRFWMQH